MLICHHDLIMQFAPLGMILHKYFRAHQDIYILCTLVSKWIDHIFFGKLSFEFWMDGYCISFSPSIFLFR
jgi:hypothetical protein